jgi:hypothetical protein
MNPPVPQKKKNPSPPPATLGTPPRPEVPPLGLLPTSTHEATEEDCPLDLDEADASWRSVPMQYKTGLTKGARLRLGKVRVVSVIVYKNW